MKAPPPCYVSTGPPSLFESPGELWYFGGMEKLLELFVSLPRGLQSQICVGGLFLVLVGLWLGVILGAFLERLKDPAFRAYLDGTGPRPPRVGGWV